MLDISRDIYFLEQEYFYEFAWNFKVFQSFYIIKRSISKCVFQNQITSLNPTCSSTGSSWTYLAIRFILHFRWSLDVYFVPDLKYLLESVESLLPTHLHPPCSGSGYPE